MTHKVDLTEVLINQINNFSEQGKGENWRLNKHDLAMQIYNNTIANAILAINNDLCSKLNGDAQEQLQPKLLKAQKKLAFAERINAYLASDSDNVDPRIEKLLLKMNQMGRFNGDTNEEEITKIHAKIKYYTEKLREFTSGPNINNEQTESATAELQELLDGMQRRLLNIRPERKEVDEYSCNMNRFYRDCEDRESCFRMGNVYVVKQFFDAALSGRRNQELDPSHIFSRGHRDAAELIRKKTEEGNPPQNLSILELVEAEKADRFRFGLDIVPVPFPEQILAQKPDLQENGISFNPAAGEEEIANQLEFLEKLKTANGFHDIGALFTIGTECFGLTINQKSYITLINPTSDVPYIMTFGDFRQTADFLHRLLAEKLHENGELGQLPVKVDPFCNKDEVDRVAREKEYAYEEEALETRMQMVGLNWDFLNQELPTENDVMKLEEDYSFSRGPQSLAEVVPYVSTLQSIISLLSNGSEEGFMEAATYIFDLNEQKQAFPMSGDGERSIGDRIPFHIYHIHDKEAPQKIDRSDANYGTTAFQKMEEEGGATPLEKLRAAQRVQVEVLLSTLKTAIDRGDQAIIEEILDTLEKMKLDAKDLPQGQSNLAHALFGKVYQVYLNAWEHDKGMVHPHDGSFKGDFGRNAFIGEVSETVPAQYKLQALEEISNSVKEAWKI